MNVRRLRLVHFSIIASIATTVLGAMLGVAIQGLTHGFHFLVLITAIVAIIAIGSFAALAAILSTNEQVANESIVSSQRIYDDLKRVTTQLEHGFDVFGTSVHNDLDGLIQQFGLRVERILLNEIQEIDSLENDPSAKLILAARREILILDQLSEGNIWPDSVIEAEVSSRYLESLITKVRDSEEPIIYKRIIQVAHPREPLHVDRANWYEKHCLDMLDLKKIKGYRVSLRVTRQKFPLKFILVDRSKLVLQLQAYDNIGGHLQIWGEIMLHDPAGRIAAIFSEIWDGVEDDPQTRTVELSDLREPTDR